ncbi:MAG: flavoprotein [Cryomorphaceae bacterium BACL18 MAG-120924-bin36]|jgi:predicted Rossmann fold flavoprotein|nr:MAG: flavoprotein [Cryomorphaceae bacterium BACL18 MAG-120924-bin36]
MAECLVVVGGGAAGFFAAIAAAEANPSARVLLLEKSAQYLGKVRISGGGRCNVTHSCFDPRELVEFYPRGGQELLGPFTRFACGDTMEWFEDRGIELKVESDGRVFPVSDNSETIVHCLESMADTAGVIRETQAGLKNLVRLDSGMWHVELESGASIDADRVLLAPGSSKKIWDVLSGLGHRIVPPVPSLFTFNIRDPRLAELSGVSVSNVRVTVPVGGLETEGPLLITHWGLSGPAVLKMSAFGARWMADQDHRFTMYVNWLPQFEVEDLIEELNSLRKDVSHQRKRVLSNAMFGIPLRLWRSLGAFARLPESANWSDLSKPQLRKWAEVLTESAFTVVGKSTNKDEFVTSGGISLSEVSFSTMESRIAPGLYFAGEVLDIDALTGGFNFQAAWTTGWIAGHAMAGSPI